MLSFTYNCIEVKILILNFHFGKVHLSLYDSSLFYFLVLLDVAKSYLPEDTIYSLFILLALQEVNSKFLIILPTVPIFMFSKIMNKSMLALNKMFIKYIF